MITSHLDELADRFERTVPGAIVTGGRATFRRIELNVAGASLESITALRQALMRRLHAPDLFVEHNPDAAHLVVTLPQPSTPNPHPLTLPLGRDRLGDPVLLDLANPKTAHLHIMHPRSHDVLRHILLHLARTAGQRDLQIAVIDPDQSLAVGGLPHLLAPPAWHSLDIAGVVERLIDAWQRRQQHRYARPALVLAVTSLDLAPAVVEFLAAVANDGARAALHLILAGADPGADLDLPVTLVGEAGEDAVLRWQNCSEYLEPALLAPDAAASLIAAIRRRHGQRPRVIITRSVSHAAA